MLKKKLQEDLTQAMRAQDSVKTSTLRLLLSGISYFEISKGKDYEASDQDVIAVIQKQIKQHQESIDAYTRGGRSDLVAKETNELGILKSYVPQVSFSSSTLPR